MKQAGRCILGSFGHSSGTFLPAHSGIRCNESVGIVSGFVLTMFHLSCFQRFLPCVFCNIYKQSRFAVSVLPAQRLVDRQRILEDTSQVEGRGSLLGNHWEVVVRHGSNRRRGDTVQRTVGVFCHHSSLLFDLEVGRQASEDRSVREEASSHHLEVAGQEEDSHWQCLVTHNERQVRSLERGREEAGRSQTRDCLAWKAVLLKQP